MRFLKLPLLWLSLLVSSCCGFLITGHHDTNHLKGFRIAKFDSGILVGSASSAQDGRWGQRISVSEDSEDAIDIGSRNYLNPYFLNRNKRWVVLVDDEAAIRLAVGDFLYSHGYHVTACDSSDAFLRICQTPGPDGELPAVPDVIISDVRMPGKDGIELLSMIRQDERLARVPVILLTAKAMTQDRVLGYKAGANVYLPKPFNPDELLGIVDNAIERNEQMSGKGGNLRDLKDEMKHIKEIMRRNSSRVVKRTKVYLTDMQREVLALVCQGYTNGEIADDRGVGVAAINRTVQKLYMKTSTRNRTELVRWAISTGYVPARS